MNACRPRSRLLQNRLHQFVHDKPRLLDLVGSLARLRVLLLGETIHIEVLKQALRHVDLFLALFVSVGLNMVAQAAGCLGDIHFLITW